MDNFMTDMAQLNPIAPAPVYNQYNPNPIAANIASRTPVAHHKANHDSEGPVGCMSYCRPDEEATCKAVLPLSSTPLTAAPDSMRS